MESTIYSMCSHVNNWFAEKKIIGEITIRDGQPQIDIGNYRYIRIIKSNDNDGIHKVDEMELTDETFDGAVWLLKIPKPFIELSEKVGAWQTEHAGKEMFQSESFGGYSYSRNADALTWQGTFKSDLDAWRKKR